MKALDCVSYDLGEYRSGAGPSIMLLELEEMNTSSFGIEYDGFEDLLISPAISYSAGP